MSIDREKVLVAAQKFVEKKRYPQAVAEYQKIIEQDPNDARTLLKIGDLQLKMEAFPEAIATYERVGRHYAAQGFALKAIAVYKQIREIVGKNVPHLEERYAHIPPKLAELYQQLGLVSDALSALDEVATRLQRQQRDTEAIEIFRKIVGLDPTNPLPHLRLAEALSRTRDADGAVSEFSVAAALLVKLGRRDDALKVLERLLHHRPEPAQARLAAELYIARGTQPDAMQALAKLQICFQANPKDLTTLDLLAKAFVVLGQAKKGIEVQKEMARIARDQQRLDVLNDVVERLLVVAPDDEAVHQLAASRDELLAAQRAAEADEEPAIPTPEGTEEIADAEILEDAVVEVDDEPAMIPEPAMSEAEPILLRASEAPGEAPEIVAGGELEAVDLSNDARLPQLLEEARSYRRVRLYARAIKALADALEIDGRSIPVRVELRDVYLESGETGEAVMEMIHIASLQLDGLDGDGAAATLQDVLALDPENERAMQMLRELGYAPVEEQAPAPYVPPAQGRARLDSYDPEAPLPSYDLEEVSTSQAFAESKVAAAGTAAAAEEEDAPLPSFPLDAPESEAQFELVPPSRTMEDGVPALAEGPTSSYAKPTNEEIEEALEEADFFASRGLFDDARAVLNDALARAPQHRLLLERRSEIDAQATASGGSGTRAKPQSSIPAQGAVAAAPAPVLAADEDFDIAASLDALEALDVAPEASQLVNDTGQVDVEEVFAAFKEGVAKTLSVDDGQAHYDLGLAYKEMGLADDAIGEFETAARDAKLECVARSMVGMIQVERGNLKEAIAAFQKGLAARVRTPEQETVLCFEIGAAYEGLRLTKEAVSFFQRVVRRDPTYRDVQERLRRLTKPEMKPQVQKLAVGADDEFDRAFDELLGSGGKLP